MSHRGEAELVQDALSGSPDGTRRFVAHVLPVVHARIGRVLARRGRREGRDGRQETEDLGQEVFVALFEADARTLRAWDPARGMSLLNFVGLVAEREAASILRSGRRSPWTDSAQEQEVLERSIAPDRGAEARLLSRDLLLALADRLREKLSLRGLELFERLVVQEESIESVGAAYALSADAVYAWKSRLGKVARAIALELQPPSSSGLVGASRSPEIAS